MVEIDISVIVPVRDAGETLGECLRAVRRAAQGLEVEMIVVDDHSTDGSAEIARKNGAAVFVMQDKTGPAAARNLGSARARGEVLVFVDADAIVPPDALSKVLWRIRDGGWDGLIGVPSPTGTEGPPAGQMKNLWMHYTYTRLPEQVPLFLTTFAAIVREKFQAAGGFDEAYQTPSVEDTDFGHRLSEKGVRILLDVGLEVEHRRPMEWRDVLRLDRARATALTRLALRERERKFATEKATSVPVTHMISVVACGAAAVFFLPGLVLLDPGFILGCLLCLACSVATLGPFLLYMKRWKPVPDVARAAGFLLVDHFAVIYGIAQGIYGYRRGEKY